MASSDNVFVGDLPVDITVDQIQSIFSAYGTVQQARVNAPKRPGQKASALVRFGSSEEATWVVQNLNGNLAQGLEEPIVVRYANNSNAQQPQSNAIVPANQPVRPPGQQGAGGSDNIFVGDLPSNMTNDMVSSIFSSYGTVVQCRAMPPKTPGGKASALVRFGSVDEATWVVNNLNGNLAEGLQEPVVVRFANGSGGAAPPQQQAAFAAPVKPQNSGDNVFVGDLPSDITSELVKSVFSAYGTVVQCRAMPPKGAGGKSSALVRFASHEEAKWVVDNLNGNLAEGLQEPVVVRFAAGGGNQENNNNWNGNYGAQTFGQGKGAFRQQPYNQANPAAMKFGGHKRPGIPDSFNAFFTAIRKAGVLGEARVAEDSQVYINQLPADTTDKDLYRLFAPFGPVSNVKAMLNPDGSCKGFGFVDFVDPANAEAAITAIQGFSLPDGSSIVPSLKRKAQE